jgi:hypothetical protein
VAEEVREHVDKMLVLQLQNRGGGVGKKKKGKKDKKGNKKWLPALRAPVAWRRHSNLRT